MSADLTVEQIVCVVDAVASLTNCKTHRPDSEMATTETDWIKSI